MGNPTGGLYASLDDMLLYTNFLAGAGTKAQQKRYESVLSKKTLEEMLSKKVKVVAPGNGFEVWMGLGVYITTYKGKTSYHHGGSQFGFSSYTFFERDTQTGVLFIFNSETPKVIGQFMDIAQSNINAKFLLGWRQ